jgi:hypothetical protein
MSRYKYTIVRRWNPGLFVKTEKEFVSVSRRVYLVGIDCYPYFQTSYQGCYLARAVIL